MIRILYATLVATLFSANSSAAETADQFLDNLRQMCGQAFAGQLVEYNDSDADLLGQEMVMHVRECSEDEIRIPFFVGEDRSRTWVFTRTTDGLRLKHDHRHEDGSEDEITQYGGDATGGSSTEQSFPADAWTRELIPYAANNTWTVVIKPGESYSYRLRRAGTDRRFRVDFDLTEPVAPPPPPWGATTAEQTTINFSDATPLFDGRCHDDEWQSATRLELPAELSILLMHNGDSLFVCAAGKAEDYTVIDLYIEDKESGELLNLHASAQLSDRKYVGDDWSEPVRWENKNWSGFWVPYAGNEETESGNRATFLKGSDREIQVLRRKFAGSAWNMMIRISGVYHDGEYGAEFSWPENASDRDQSTWGIFEFADH